MNPHTHDKSQVSTATKKQVSAEKLLIIRQTKKFSPPPLRDTRVKKSPK